MSKPFWGLYEGLSTIETQNQPSSSNSGQKRKLDSSTMVPRAKRVASVPAPRTTKVVTLKTTPPSQTTPKTSSTVTTPTVVPVNPTSVVVKKDDVSGEAVRSSNITHALNEIKDPYDPSVPNEYDDYRSDRQKREEMMAAKRASETSGMGVLTPNISSKKNVGESILKKMGWKGKGHGIGKRGINAEYGG
eukprot:TRINITY_DN7885_c0_g2_i1.p1 TRINITY_DN7885_c0_g2~~TRINITY_DN7885_c0_g2_i1.p1  ORF type:complete len:204 (-),score=43.72 TRINITY_DN7885_c0_g2_i1:188-757(-)